MSLLRSSSSKKTQIWCKNYQKEQEEMLKPLIKTIRTSSLIRQMLQQIKDDWHASRVVVWNSNTASVDYQLWIKMEHLLSWEEWTSSLALHDRTQTLVAIRAKLAIMPPWCRRGWPLQGKRLRRERGASNRHYLIKMKWSWLEEKQMLNKMPHSRSQPFLAGKPKISLAMMTGRDRLVVRHRWLASPRLMLTILTKC